MDSAFSSPVPAGRVVRQRAAYRTALVALATTATAIAALMAPVHTASALDGRYQDANGDLVADRPEDAAQWRDPTTLVFAFSPAEDPAVFADVWKGFLAHLADVTGKRVQYFAVQSNASEIEAMRAGRLHVAAFATGAVPLAVNCAGFVPFAMMTANDGRFGYRMQIITRNDSPLQHVADVKGKRLAFTSESSNSGYKAPAAVLEKQFGLRQGQDYQAVFSGKHDNSILGVVHRDYDAAAVASGIARRMAGRGVVQLDSIRVLYESDPFPTPAYGYAHDLKPELAQAIEKAFFTFDWEGSALQREFGASEPPQQRFVPISYLTQWQIVRDVDAAMGQSTTCR
ncbi:phosphate/phosphite/phosphonate ABC transporter substrate-binding protein [Lampropedia puyangensis]|uniref:Phosphate/phosphite/phosphonate ABC transporter substrate-binding protein n=1 Tax=Lampropedia puyangensis TaxID=1330072 RepID=A0A4S8F527_9BURK|nr:phosphate/phosphite/phosphonate ABC transporter substrate-binding protein [Lampropedia puyangensis]THU02530.1 phosphate/phosphite/phosphonate ABC transporter substrate-binding protein [Lampropedia puyangensis]